MPLTLHRAFLYTDQMRRKAQVWIVHGKKEVLVFQTTAERGAFWQPITGSIEEGESTEQGARREFQEETGFDPYKGSWVTVGAPFHFTDSRGAEIEEHVFACLLPQRSQPRLDPKEHQAAKWVSYDEALSLLKYPSNADKLRELWGTLK